MRIYRNLLYIVPMSQVHEEICSISPKDCFGITERRKNSFTYPLHKHNEFELNFVQNAKGVRRIVGDSVETIGDYDLVLLGPGGLEHVWEQGECTSTDIKELTIQFDPALYPQILLEKSQFASIGRMFQDSRRGIAFSMEAIMRVYRILESLAANKDSFAQTMDIMNMFHILSQSDYRVLSSGSFSRVENTESRRIRKVKDYISEHYMEELKLDDIASIVGMSPSSFSRFFKTKTLKTLSSYIVDIRLGMAARELVDTSKNVSEICYNCGFNNLSNFNRAFKASKGMSPTAFREIYKKKKVIV